LPLSRNSVKFPTTKDFLAHPRQSYAASTRRGDTDRAVDAVETLDSVYNETTIDSRQRTVHSRSHRKDKLLSSLYNAGQSGQMSVLGNLIHETMRSSKPQGLGRMSFSLKMATPRSLPQQFQAQSTTPFTPAHDHQDKKNVKNWNDSAINALLEKSGAEEMFSQSCTSKKQKDNLLEDSYLPMLRNFATTQRFKAKPAADVVAEFRKNQAAESVKPLMPKLIEKEAINRERKPSLVERQRDILVRAQMQKPANRAQARSMQRTRFKDWVCRDGVG